MVLHLLMAQNPLARDTIVTVAARDGYDLVLVIAAVAVTLTAVTALLTGILALYAAREAARATERLKEHLTNEPTFASFRRTVENAEAISDLLRSEAGKLTGSVTRLSEKVDLASERIEERIEDLNALVEVVQEEVEGSFVKGAAVARGFRAGFGKLMGRRERSARPTQDDHL
jgi:hypothetical protein